MTAQEALAQACRASGVSPPPHGVNTGMVLAGMLIDALPPGWELVDEGMLAKTYANGEDMGIATGEKAERDVYARLVEDGYDVDARRYHLDPIYHGIVQRIHRGTPQAKPEADPFA